MYDSVSDVLFLTRKLGHWYIGLVGGWELSGAGGALIVPSVYGDSAIALVPPTLPVMLINER